MQGVKPDENIRRPMQWGADGGFTTGEPWRSYYEDYQERHVTAQSETPDSLLNHYRALIRLRNEHIALRQGNFIPLESACRPIYGYLRRHKDENMLVIMNLAAQEQVGCTLSLAESGLAPGDYAVRELLTSVSASALTVNENGGFDYAPLETFAPREEYILLLVGD